MNVRTIGAVFLSCAAMMPVAAAAQISIGISVRLAPPPLPVYAQPPLPGPDYLWTPGYWAWDDFAAAYYWVPGTWVRAPRPGLLWTPPWWGWSQGAYLFHTGYWGPHIGFYGGVVYGFGYTGFGYQGGYWNGGHLFYNQTVNNITNLHVTNIYQTNVINNYSSHVSYNGGPGGVRAQPRIEEQQAAHDPHVAPTVHQQDHVQAARADPRAFASANRGHPPIAATPHALSGQNNSAATNRSENASVRREPYGQHGVTQGEEATGAARTPQEFGQQPDRSVIGSGNAEGHSRSEAPRPPAPRSRAGADGDPFTPERALERHESRPHMPAPPHAPKPSHMPRPAHPHPQGHHGDHHHD